MYFIEKKRRMKEILYVYEEEETQKNQSFHFPFFRYEKIPSSLGFVQKWWVLCEENWFWSIFSLLTSKKENIFVFH